MSGKKPKTIPQLEDRLEATELQLAEAEQAIAFLKEAAETEAAFFKSFTGAIQEALAEDAEGDTLAAFLSGLLALL